jgi:hypothetical protein
MSKTHFHQGTIIPGDEGVLVSYESGAIYHTSQTTDAIKPVTVQLERPFIRIDEMQLADYRRAIINMDRRRYG